MKKAQKAVIASLIGTSAIAWIASIEQPDMMVAMTTYNPLAISLFTASWTAGMAAMMFPAIVPMVLLYNRLVANNNNNNKEGKKEANQNALIVQEEDDDDVEGQKPMSSSSFSSSSSPIRSLRVILFIGCYLLVWALTGIALLLGWSVVMNNTIMSAAAAGGNSSQPLPIIYGALLIIAGVYQFTPLKRACMGYCESPLSFFMRRWKDGTFGAVRMGLWHGLYCLGCCWPYFLLMLALGWMNLLWMGLFAGIIFGEKMWSRGIWVARAAGIGLVITGILVISGMLPSLVSSSAASSMMSGESGGMGSSDGVVMENGGAVAMGPGGDGSDAEEEDRSPMTNDNSSEEGSMRMQNPVTGSGNNNNNNNDNNSQTALLTSP